ncbi:UNKNOWN [Stylonychia lemnae]|uniref:Uncharacterized protein n=1 Tax=Stylonychia lemnae TaxID=5949 RepID=A0A078B128_STYLE|nr:UNKNOWN [Stylonychia lemnae]|eukprot:CDW88325.1 UNKNOWN [Stylonychia lemnae]
MEMQSNFQKFAKIEEKAKQRTAFIVKKMKNFRSRFMKQVKYEMTRKSVKNLPQEEFNDEFVSADEYREILNQDLKDDSIQDEKMIKISFLDKTQATLKQSNSTFSKMSTKQTFQEQKTRLINQKGYLGLLLKPSEHKLLSLEQQQQHQDQMRENFRKKRSGSVNQIVLNNQAEVQRRMSSDSMFLTSILEQHHKKQSMGIETKLPALAELDNSIQRRNSTFSRRGSVASSHSQRSASIVGSTYFGRNKNSIPSFLLPQVKETDKQKMRIDKIIDNCKRLQEKEAISSQKIKTTARTIDDGVNQDFNKLQKKIQIILSLNNEINTRDSKASLVNNL